MKRTWIQIAALFAVSVVAVGCGGGGGGGGGGGYTAWYDVYGRHCGSGRPMPGCNFYSDGSKITDWEDPYYYSHYLEYGTWEYTDSYGYRQYYTGYAWLSGTGILYDDLGYALNEEDAAEGRDMMTDLAAKEKEVVTEAGKGFASQYALAEATGVQIASTLNAWANLGKKHGRTEKDLADFSKRLYGVKVDQVKPALTKAAQGDLSALQSLNNDVATHWSTDPETSKEILMSWFKKEANSFQIR